MMKRFCFFIISALLLTACHENLEERAEREATEYTKRYCPTPIINNTRTDSLVFNKAKKEFIFYCSLWNELDNALAIERIRPELHDGLEQSLTSDPDKKKFIDEGFIYSYVVSSGSSPDKILFKDTFTFDKK